MENLKQIAEELYDSIKPAYFQALEQQIEHFSNIHDNVSRLKLGNMYNSFQSIRYTLKRLDFSSPNAEQTLNYLSIKADHLRKQYWQIVGKRLPKEIASQF